MSLIQETLTSPGLHSNLFAATQIFPVVANNGQLAVNQGDLVAGTVLGRVTATGLLKVVDKSKSDGTQTPYAILALDVSTPTTGTSVRAPIYLTGEFNEDALDYGADTAADHRVKLREIGIFLKKNIPA